MSDFLKNVSIDRFSFWLGFFAGGVFFWFWRQLRANLPDVIRASKQRVRTLREEMSSGSEERYRHEVALIAQRQHLASMMFSLDEILIQPGVLAPPPATQPQNEQEEFEDVYHLTLPYIPDWPEFGAFFGAPTLTLPEALSGGKDLVLTGNPGSGKTVALAYLATLLARRSPEFGELNHYLPVFVHAADLPLDDKENKDSLVILTEAVTTRVSPLTAARLPGVLKNAFLGGRVLLLLDGLDEFPPHQIEIAAAWLEALLKRFPQTRLVAAASHENYDGLTHLGLFPVGLSAWTNGQRKEFTKRWGDLWQRYILRGHATEDNIDPLLVNDWLANTDIQSTPLEFTLKVWAGYAGDILGASTADVVEAYVRRMSLNIPKARQVLEKLAAHSILNMSPAVDIRQAEKWVPEAAGVVPPFDQNIGQTEQKESESLSNAEDSRQNLEPANGTAKKDLKKPLYPPSLRVLPDLIFNGLLTERRDGKISFIHPVVAGYLSGPVLSSTGEENHLAEQPDWTGKLTAMRFLVDCSDLTSIIVPMVEEKLNPAYRKQNQVWHWITDAPKVSRWRSTAMRNIAALLQQESQPMALRARAMTAIALSGDPGVLVLFRQMLTHRHESVRTLAVLGLGMLRDSKMVNELSAYLSDGSLQVARAAVLALTSCGSKQALGFVADVLLNGTEELRRAAAEAFAGNPEDGHPALKDGVEMEDLLVRRAVVYGLLRVQQAWAKEILQKIQIEDGQWVVRSAATQAVEELSRLNPHIPQPAPPLSETPWLISFAGSQGVGITPSTAREMLVKALKLGEPKQRQAALEYLGLYGNEENAPDIYHWLYGSDGILRETAYHALWNLSSAGVRLPAPIQFGLGDYL